MRLLFTLLSILLLVGCTITKRHFGVGYHVEWKKAYSKTENEEDKEKELQVFPNPTTDLFTLVFPRASGHYLVADMNGHIFEDQPVGEETKTQYLRLSKGVYFLRWVDGEAVITKKIIVL